MGAAAAIAGTGLGIYQAIEEAKEKDSARRELENYKRQELDNVQENRTVSTLGADRQREEQSRLTSTQVDALRGAGTRGLVGGLGRVEVGNQNVNQQIAANLDMQQKEIDAAIAQDEANIRAMRENRENADIAALSSQYQAGGQNLNTGLGTAIMGAGMLGNQYAAMKGADSSRGNSVSVTGNATGPNTPMSPTSDRFSSSVILYG